MSGWASRTATSRWRSKPQLDRGPVLVAAVQRSWPPQELWEQPLIASRLVEAVIVAAALVILRREGAAKLTARAIASVRGCSTQPIYTSFSDMAGLEEALLAEARALFLDALLIRGPHERPYAGIGPRLLASGSCSRAGCISTSSGTVGRPSSGLS